MLGASPRRAALRRRLGLTRQANDSRRRPGEARAPLFCLRGGKRPPAPVGHPRPAHARKGLRTHAPPARPRPARRTLATRRRRPAPPARPPETAATVRPPTLPCGG